MTEKRHVVTKFSEYFGEKTECATQSDYFGFHLPQLYLPSFSGWCDDKFP